MIFECLFHYMLYFLIMILLRLRFHTEILCWHIDESAEWIQVDREWTYSQPWYFRVADKPTKSTWHYINLIMQCIEAVHPHICHPEWFALPHIDYYSLGFDYNFN